MIAGVIVFARFLQYTGTLLLFGAPLFYLYGFPPSAPARGWQRPLTLISAAVALLGTILWSVAETAAMSEEPVNAMNLPAVWLMLSQTRFGLACLVRMTLLVLGLLVLVTQRSNTRWSVPMLLGSGATLSFAWTGHGAASGGVHLVADLLHLAAAAIWVGALAPLLLLALSAGRSGRSEDARALSYGLDRFSSVGLCVVVALFASGMTNSWFLIGPSRWRVLFSTGYGIVLAAKVALFAAMLGLAMLNRYRLSPSLTSALGRRGNAASQVAAFRSSLFAESMLAALVLIAVSMLGMLAPLSSTD